MKYALTKTFPKPMEALYVPSVNLNNYLEKKEAPVDNCTHNMASVLKGKLIKGGNFLVSFYSSKNDTFCMGAEINTRDKESHEDASKLLQILATYEPPKD